MSSPVGIGVMVSVDTGFSHEWFSEISSVVRQKYYIITQKYYIITSLLQCIG